MVRKRVLIGPPDRSGVRECAGWVFGGVGGRPDAQRSRNQCCRIMHTEMPALKDNIGC